MWPEILGKPPPWLEGIESAKRPARLPIVLMPQEVESIFAHLNGTVGLMIQLLYGTGMRIRECVRLRVKVEGLVNASGRFTAPRRDARAAAGACAWQAVVASACS